MDGFCLMIDAPNGVHPTNNRLTITKRVCISKVVELALGGYLINGAAPSSHSCEMSFSLHKPNFRQNNFTPKNACFLAITGLRQSNVIVKIQ